MARITIQDDCDNTKTSESEQAINYLTSPNESLIDFTCPCSNCGMILLIEFSMSSPDDVLCQTCHSILDEIDAVKYTKTTPDLNFDGTFKQYINLDCPVFTYSTARQMLSQAMYAGESYDINYAVLVIESIISIASVANKLSTKLESVGTIELDFACLAIRSVFDQFNTVDISEAEQVIRLQAKIASQPVYLDTCYLK